MWVGSAEGSMSEESMLGISTLERKEMMPYGKGRLSFRKPEWEGRSAPGSIKMCNICFTSVSKTNCSSRYFADFQLWFTSDVDEKFLDPLSLFKLMKKSSQTILLLAIWLCVHPRKPMIFMKEMLSTL